MSLEDDLLYSAIRELGIVPPERLDPLKSGPRPLRQALVEDGLLSQDMLSVVLKVASRKTALPSSGSYLGRYRLVSELGRGAMGVVYRAEDTTLGRPVALKVLSMIGSDERTVERFEREARLSAHLKHPRIVTIHDAGVENGLPYIAMELIEGTTFQKTLPELDLRTRVSLLRAVAEAVDAAHQAGIVHRDLKPSNILLDAKREPYVTDFGLARELSRAGSLTGSGIAVGTPAYMAPEQAAGDSAAIDERSDIYALGVILYQCLTLRTPFEAPAVAALMRKVIEEQPVPPSARSRDVDRDIEAVCLKAMAKRREERYRSARALADDLGRWLEGLPVEARVPSTVRLIVRRVRPLRLMVLASVLLAGLAVAWFFTRPSRLEVAVEPGGARVSVDGRPGAAHRLSAGRHRVRIELEGYRSVEEDVDLARGESLARKYTLVPTSGTLRIRCDGTVRVRGGEVDREAHAYWEGVVPPGRYRVDVRSPGRSLLTLSVDVDDREVRELAPEPPDALVWKVEIGPVNLNPAQADFDGDGRDDVVVANDEAELWILSGATGGRILRRAMGGDAVADPALLDLDGDRFPEIALPLANGKVPILEGKERTMRLTLSSNAPMHLAHSFGRMRPADRGHMIFLTKAGVLARWRDTGADLESLWGNQHSAAPDAAPVLADVDGDGTVEILMSTRTELCIHHSADGKGRLRYDLAGGPRSPILVADADGDGRVEAIVGLRDGSLVCLDPRERRILWTFMTQGGIYARPAFANGAVFAGSEDGIVYAIDGKTGAERWRYKTGAEVHSGLITGDFDGDGRIDVAAGSDDDEVHVLDAETGKALWTFRCGEDIDAALLALDADGDGVPEIVAASNDGWVYCLRVRAKP